MALHHNTMMALLLAALAGTAAAQDGVSVSFEHPERFIDAGQYGPTRERNLKTIADYLQKLGHDRLAPGQTLKIDVLDVDLAGTPRPSQRVGEYRVVRGNSDRPAITLRYTLAQNGQVVGSGTDSVYELDYIDPIRTVGESESLHFEKKLIAKWFDQRFATNKAAAG